MSIDILLRMREHIQKGEPPGNCADAVVHSSLQMPQAPQLPEEQVRYVVEKLYDGFFAFEAMTDRDWDAGIVEYVVYAHCLRVVMETVKTVLH